MSATWTRKRRPSSSRSSAQAGTGPCACALAGPASSPVRAKRARTPSRSRSGSVRAAAAPHHWTDSQIRCQARARAKAARSCGPPMRGQLRFRSGCTSAQVLRARRVAFDRGEPAEGTVRDCGGTHGNKARPSISLPPSPVSKTDNRWQQAAARSPQRRIACSSRPHVARSVGPTSRRLLAAVWSSSRTATLIKSRST